MPRGKAKEEVSPEVESSPDEELEVKQAVVNVKKTTTHLRIAGMRGGFESIVFNDNGVSTTPVPGPVRSSLAKQFPNAVIEEVDL